MEKSNEMPIFDPAAIRQMSESEIDEYGRAYTDAVDAYVRESIAQTLAPVISELEQQSEREGMRAAENDMRENADYYDFCEKQEQVAELCERIPALGAVSPKERLTMAYLMVKGAQAIGEHKNAPTRDPAQIADEIWENAEVMKLLSERRAREADTQLPVFARSAAGAAAVPKPPATLSDASAQARKHFA